MPDKKPPKYHMTVKFPDGYVATFTLDEILSKLRHPGMPQSLPDEVRIGMERDGIEMHAEFSPTEAEYPGITIDASTAQAGEIWLGNFELPNESYPTRIQARLYAGCHKYETDGPIAIATHEITDDARVIYRSGKYGGQPRPMRKLVYIDHDLAGSRTWKEPGEENMPEHQEDE